MTKHKIEDRVPVMLDISQFFEFYKMAQIGIHGMQDEINKAVIAAGVKLPDRRNGEERRKTKGG